MKEGWEYNKIGKLCKTYSGGTPLKNVKEYYQNGNIPWLRSGEVCKKYISETEMFITQKVLENSSAKYYPIDTVVVAMYGATAAQVGILKIEATSNQAVCGILPNRKFLPEFLYYFFCYRKEFLASQAQGGAQPNISQVKIKNLEVPVPPLPEQQRIVDYLDSAFAKIDAMKANAEKALNEAKALFQASLKEMLEPKEGWEEKTLPEISENLDSIRKPVTKGKRTAGIYPYYGASGIVDYVDDYLFDEDLLCISEDGANLLMRTYPIAFPISGKVWVNNHAHVLRFKSIITQKYVEYYFSGMKLDDYITGAAQPKLTQKALNNIIINLPSTLDTQQSIVATLDSLKSKFDRLQANYDKISQECDALKQAILRQVFE